MTLYCSKICSSRHESKIFFENLLLFLARVSALGVKGHEAANGHEAILVQNGDALNIG